MRRLGAGLLLSAAIGLTGCGLTRAGATPPGVVTSAARLEQVPGTGGGVVVLTRAAATRLGIRTEPARPAPPAQGGTGAAGTVSVIPLAAVVYDRHGGVWTFTSTATLTYTRVPVTLVRVVGDDAVLERGPAVGTQVVTVGAAELLGVEYGVSGE